MKARSKELLDRAVGAAVAAPVITGSANGAWDIPIEKAAPRPHPQGTFPSPNEMAARRAL